MNFSFTEEQNLIRETARGYLEQSSPASTVREWMVSDKGYDSAFWKLLAEDMGWAALMIPEDYDGLGLGYVELAIIMEEMGYALTCSPLYATICQAAQAIIHGGTSNQKQTLLPQIAAGAKTATLAFGANGAFETGNVTLRWSETSKGMVLSGTASQVIDGASADYIVAAALKEDSQSSDDLRLFVLARDSEGISVTSLKTMDMTRRLARVTFDHVEVAPDAVLSGGWETFVRTNHIASIMLAAEQLGVARWLLDAAVSYSMERVQFGRAIGSFQVIKHKCADMMVLVESGLSAVYYAACVINAGTDELAEAAPIAKATLCDSAVKCAGECVQIHGGIGVTWEADVHLYFKRARAAEQLLGSPDWHREQMAQAMGL